MPEDTTILSICQNAPLDGKYLIRLGLRRPNRPELEAEATIGFALPPHEQEDLRWYLEDYLELAESAEEVHVGQIEGFMKQRGEELYTKVIAANPGTQAIWFAIREQLADLRVEIRTGIAEAASIPWELMRDPQSDSAIALRVKSFVRVQSNPNAGFVEVPEAYQGRLRLLYIVCRPGGRTDVELRAVANRLLQDLGKDLARYDITALRPPTFEQLEKELHDAKKEGRPYHIVHFDGHGVYAELKQSVLKDWPAALGHLTLGGRPTGKHGFLLFEHPGEYKIHPIDGQTLGQLLHDAGVPVLVLNACQSAMHEAVENPDAADTIHDEVRTIGSLAQAIVDQGIPAVLGMRYSVFVVTAAQYIGKLYRALAAGREFAEAASLARKHLNLNPDRWVGLQPKPLQDWFVPVVYEAGPLRLLPEKKPEQLAGQRELDPVQLNRTLLRYVPDHGFVGRDETLLILDRAFDDHPAVLLHAYAGQGKTTTVVEFARWYAQTGGLGGQPVVVLTSFEHPVTLDEALDGLVETRMGQEQPLLSRLVSQGKDWLTMNKPGQKRSEAANLLRQIPVLWIWDNVEPVGGFPEGTESAWTVAQQAELAEFLKQLKLDKATKVKILLTSRRDERKWLGGIPHRVKMPRMSPADAARLAVQLGKKKLTPDEIARWQPLLGYCAGNPLTLRVIAGQAIKMDLRTEEQIEQFIQAVRDGEQHIDDADEAQGRDKSLGASLDYGFRSAFTEDELPVIALLHLFQGTVDIDALDLMGKGDGHALPEVRDKTKQHLAELLERAGEIGLLAHLDSTHYTIHPALPWFLRQLFARHYDGQDGRSGAEAALRAWVEAIGALGTYYHGQFNEGNQDVIRPLALEEANLLHARRSARRHGWWPPLTSTMQGLDELYGYQGRPAEWARLVAEIVPDYCTGDDQPVPGREDQYSVVMGYRVDLAQNQERDLTRAATLQEKRVAWVRRQAAAALALPEGAPLDDRQRNDIRTLGVSVFTLGQILREQGSSECVSAYQEAIRHCQRIEDTTAEAFAHHNIAHAYMQLPDIRDLDAAEAAYQCGLDLREPNDALGRSICIKQIGLVHHKRFREARERDEPPGTLLKHARAAEEHYRRGLNLCPASAIAALGPMRGQLGCFYADVGQTDRAQEYFEKSVQICEQTGDRYSAGKIRFNMGLTYLRAAEREENPARQRELLVRAQAYAQAALRDYQHYEGRAAAEETEAQRLIDIIGQAFDK